MSKLNSLIKIALNDLSGDDDGHLKSEVNYYSSIYRKGLIGRGNRNPEALSDAELKVYKKLKLSDKDKNKAYRFARFQTLGKGGKRREYYAKSRLDNFKYLSQPL